MVKITLKFKNNKIRAYKFSAKEITIGRQQGNDIIIDNPGVSKQHCIIKYLDGKYIIVDLKSTNGTYINEIKVDKTELTSGDEIIIGKHRLCFSTLKEGHKKEHSLNAGSLQSIEMKTMLLETKEQKALISKQRLNSSKRYPTIAVIQSETEVIYELKKELTTVGSSKDSDIVIKRFLFPKKAFTIQKQIGSFYFSGYGGWISVRLNGKIAGKNWKLDKNDIIEVRNIKVIFKG